MPGLGFCLDGVIPPAECGAGDESIVGEEGTKEGGGNGIVEREKSNFCSTESKAKRNCLGWTGLNSTLTD